MKKCLGSIGPISFLLILVMNLFVSAGVRLACNRSAQRLKPVVQLIAFFRLCLQLERHILIIHSALLHHNDSGQWLSFREPVSVLATHDPQRVISLMTEVETRVEAENLTAVGFVTHEAAQGFDPGMAVHADSEMPLVCFALFSSSEVVAAPIAPRRAVNSCGVSPRAPNTIKASSSRYAALSPPATCIKSITPRGCRAW